MVYVSSCSVVLVVPSNPLGKRKGDSVRVRLGLDYSVVSRAGFGHGSLDLGSRLLRSFLGLKATRRRFPRRTKAVILGRQNGNTLISNGVTKRHPIASLKRNVMRSMLTPGPITFKVRVLRYARKFLQYMKGAKRNYYQYSSAVIIITQTINYVTFNEMTNNRSPTILTMAFMLFKVLRTMTMIKRNVITRRIPMINVTITRITQIRASIQMLYPRRKATRFLNSIIFRFRERTMKNEIKLSTTTTYPTIIMN